MKAGFLAALVLLAVAASGCGKPATVHVTVDVVAAGFSGGNVSVEVWDPGNLPKVSLHFTMEAGQNMTVANFDGPAGEYTARASAGINSRVQEGIRLGANTPRLTVLASDGGVRFSLDGGKTPL